MLRERTHGRELEEIGDRQTPAEPLGQRGLCLHEEQRMSAEVEEVVIAPDLIDGEQALPNLGNRLLELVIRRDEDRVDVWSCVAGGFRRRRRKNRLNRLRSPRVASRALAKIGCR